MEIEFRYGVLDGEISIPKEDASDITSCRSSLALDLPCDDVRVLKDSSHSSVSSGSVSGRVWRGSGGGMAITKLLGRISSQEVFFEWVDGCVCLCWGYSWSQLYQMALVHCPDSSDSDR